MIFRCVRKHGGYMEHDFWVVECGIYRMSTRGIRWNSAITKASCFLNNTIIVYILQLKNHLSIIAEVYKLHSLNVNYLLQLKNHLSIKAEVYKLHNLNIKLFISDELWSKFQQLIQITLVFSSWNHSVLLSYEETWFSTFDTLSEKIFYQYKFIKVNIWASGNILQIILF